MILFNLLSKYHYQRSNIFTICSVSLSLPLLSLGTHLLHIIFFFSIYPSLEIRTGETRAKKQEERKWKMISQLVFSHSILILHISSSLSLQYLSLSWVFPLSLSSHLLRPFLCVLACERGRRLGRRRSRNQCFLRIDSSRSLLLPFHEFNE